MCNEAKKNYSRAKSTNISTDIHVSRTYSTCVYRGAYKSLARHTSLSIVFSIQGIGGSPTGPDPENRAGDQDTGSRVRPVYSGLQVPSEPFPSWSG
jgi:hypothetical protein